MKEIRKELGMDEAPSSEVEELATPTGLEPVISAVTGRRVNHYTKGPDARDENPRTNLGRFTSLLPNPVAEKPQRSQTRVRAPSDLIPDSEPWDQWKARAAHKRRQQQERAKISIAHSLANHMMDGLVLTESERLRLHSVIFTTLYTEVSGTSVAASIEAVAS